jgi:nitrogen fixation/metabolism regulation signal transduction histidine kinase
MLKLEAEFDAVLQSQLADADAHVAWVLVGALVLFNIALAALAVFVTHRMAGPIFVMRRYVREIGEGKLPVVRKLRKGDEFVELIDEMSHTVSELETRVKTEIGLIEKVLELLKDDDTAAAVSARVELAALAEVKRAMLAR